MSQQALVCCLHKWRSATQAVRLLLRQNLLNKLQQEVRYKFCRFDDKSSGFVKGLCVVLDVANLPHERGHSPANIKTNRSIRNSLSHTHIYHLCHCTMFTVKCMWCNSAGWTIHDLIGKLISFHLSARLTRVCMCVCERVGLCVCACWPIEAIF